MGLNSHLERNVRLKHCQGACDMKVGLGMSQ